MMSPRDDFASALDALRAAQAEYWALGPSHPLSLECDAAVLAAVAATKGGKAKAKRLDEKRRANGLIDLSKAEKILGLEACITVRKPFVERSNELVKELGDRVDALKKAADDAAERAGPEAIETDRATPYLCLASVSESSYGSQGYGARSYARNSAESRADVARACGVDVEITEDVRTWEGLDWSGRMTKHSLSTFHVCVGVASKVDVELLKRLPGPTLREQVRLCWKRGVQPRVFNPFLPHDYEEKNGLDYFGNDLRVGKARS